jgi:hypothetical protein
MNDRQRSALLGLLVGVTHTFVRLFAPTSGATAIDANLTLVLVESLVTTGLLLAVVPGLPMYGAHRLTTSRSDPVRLAAVVAVGTGVGVLLTYPLLTAANAGAPFLEALRIRFVGPYLVNALSPAVYSGVAALAGFLLAARAS